jgi:hypothetical protein
MPLLSSNNVTLAEWAKRQDPDRKVAKIIEMLSQTNEILQDMSFMEGNLPTGHRTTMRTGLPSSAWRLLNQGIQPSKSRTAQVDEQCGMLEAFSEVDVALAKLNGDVGAFRLSESQSFIESMNIEMASTIFYGNSSVNPEEFTGIAIRYSDLSAANAQNIIDAGGIGSDNTSIFLVGWGEQSICGIFPKGSDVGLSHDDLGVETVENAGGVSGAKMRAYREHFKWDIGIALKDWRYCVRICNIDVSALVAKVAAADLSEQMIKAIHRIPFIGMCKPVFYMNRSVFEYLDIQRRDDVQSGGQLKYDDVDGKRIASFRGIPVRICDAIVNSEARVV